MGIIQSILSTMIVVASRDAWRAAKAWWSLDGNMPKVDRAFHRVRCELFEVGLLADGGYLDPIDLFVSPIPSKDEAGCVYEEHTVISRLMGYQLGAIYLPLDLPHEVYVPGGTLADVIRHEYAHAWHWLDPALFDGAWFARAFGAGYDDQEPTPLEIWKRKQARNSAFRHRCDTCPNGAAFSRFVRTALRREFVSDYAMTSAKEDFAETFMFFLRYRNSLERFASRPGLYRKLDAVRRAVARAAVRNCRR